MLQGLLPLVFFHPKNKHLLRLLFPVPQVCQVACLALVVLAQSLCRTYLLVTRVPQPKLGDVVLLQRILVILVNLVCNKVLHAEPHCCAQSYVDLIVILFYDCYLFVIPLFPS